MEEGQVVCYLCYEHETEQNPYVKEPQPCMCKGSIVIHKHCFENVIKSTRKCSICKARYNLHYLPNRNGLELITEVAINGDIIEYTVDDSGNKQGEEIKKKQTGEIISRCNYAHGILNGKYRTWYLTGQIECECCCILNRIDGEFKMWHQNGKLKEQSFYENGLREGQYRLWDDKGNLEKSIIYSNGEPMI